MEVTEHVFELLAQIAKFKGVLTDNAIATVPCYHNIK